MDLYQTERQALHPLPTHVPEVYALHHRTVDLEGYVHLHTNCYSAPPELIGRRLELRETKDKVKLFDGPRRVAEHRRQIEGSRVRSTLPEHCPKGRTRPHSRQRPKLAEETLLRAAGRPFDDFLDLMKKKHGRSARRVRRFHRIYMEYPTGAVRAALDEALTYGMTDLERLERMVLRQVAGDYFRLSATDHDDSSDES